MTFERIDSASRCKRAVGRRTAIVHVAANADDDGTPWRDQVFQIEGIDRVVLVIPHRAAPSVYPTIDPRGTPARMVESSPEWRSTSAG